ncbi:hypothetical protein RhiirA5_425573 [Rhizophagus irregularis]|uniref:Uncharacterized protein n=1 Tax=Rhizophagus irregularis TaxID=588596 RepID=A0A2N0QVH0_9GLOM|nr:hypothetical protein RhiirA5_425573 [Rhizophagus irregularis]PKC55052.1 hypothetical protein RhiirA1_476242 [Rhizophagus irregularis]
MEFSSRSRITHRALFRTFKTTLLDKFLHTPTSTVLPQTFDLDFLSLDCWSTTSSSVSYHWLTRGLIPSSLTSFLRAWFSNAQILDVIAPALKDFHFTIYVEIWICRSILFNAWEKSKGITISQKRSSTSQQRITTSPATSSPLSSSMASVSSDSWVSWVSSSIVQGGSWISYLDFLRRLTVQPLRLRVSFW